MADIEYDLNLYSSDFFPAWEAFAEQIKIAFEACPDDPGGPVATMQLRYAVATTLTSQLLTRAGSPEIAQKFLWLAEALQDLAEGVPHPLLTVQKKQGRQNDTSAVWRIRAGFCVSIEYLVASGMKEADAIEIALKKKHRAKLARLLRSKADLKTSIRGWRKQFKNDAANNENALAYYKEGIKRLGQFKLQSSGIQVRAEGEELLAKAADQAASLP